MLTRHGELLEPLRRTGWKRNGEDMSNNVMTDPSSPPLRPKLTVCDVTVNPSSARRPPRKSQFELQSTARGTGARAENRELESRAGLKRLLVWAHTAAARCCGVSVLVHIAAVIVLGLIVFHEPVLEEIPIRSGFAATEDDELFALSEMDITVAVPTSEASPFDRLAVSTAIKGIEFSAPTLNPGNAAGSATGEPSSGFSVGSNAVSQGSFTAWTVPEDPKPWRDYLVVIQVQLPEEVKRYRQEDLSGFLTGDDGYSTPIGQFTGPKFPKQFYGEFDMAARQFVIRIPGAAAKVKDMIEVRSGILKERQTLVIVF